MKFKKLFFIQILVIILLLFPLFSTLVNADESENGNSSSTETQGENTEDEKELNIYGKSCILIERSTGRVAYEKNADERIYPASTTKLLTAIIALEHCDLNDVVTITYEMTSQVPYNYTTAYLRVGEQVTVEELLNTLLIPSANDSGFALAIHISGSVDEFAKLMNEKAAEIGCTNSNFTNPCGVHDPNHYSTARDMSKIGIYAMNYPQIASIVCKTSYTLHENQRNARSFENTNTLILPDSKTYYEFSNGMKTGFTDQAGACLVATAKKENMEFLAVIIGCPEPSHGISYRDLDAKTLFEYGFENYDEITKVDPPSFDFLKDIFNNNNLITLIFRICLIVLILLFGSILASKLQTKKRNATKNKKK